MSRVGLSRQLLSTPNTAAHSRKSAVSMVTVIPEVLPSSSAHSRHHAQIWGVKRARGAEMLTLTARTPLLPPGPGSLFPLVPEPPSQMQEVTS